jgi:SNF2 family DNA or RNA helicase
VKFNPHPYQARGSKFLVTNPRAGLFFDPGLGKTATTLTAINALKRLGMVRKVLIVAPLRVIYSVWPKQIEAWDQFSNLKISIIHGSPAERLKALQADADIYTINPEGMAWLESLAARDPEALPSWEMLVVDESTKFKSHGAKCWKALRELLPRFERRVILTGTPSPNSLEDLWTQVFILDEGERLGKRITHFRTRWFYRGGFQGREWIAHQHSKEQIEARIADLVLRLDAQDYLELPELITNDVMVDLPADVRKAYKQLERDLFFSLDQGELVETEAVEVQAFSAGAKYLLCRQVANGGVYVEKGISAKAHRAKIEALESIVEELAGKPCLVAYQFKHDLERLQEWRPAPFIGGSVSARETDRLVDQWNGGELPLLYVQPRAMSHGLNMQGAGNDIVWFGLTDDLEVYQQTNARIYRQGVKNNVRVHRILARSTVDVAMRLRIDNKALAQKSILDALREYAKGVQ